MDFETLAIHAGKNTDQWNNSIPVPIFQTSAFEFDNVEHAVNLFDLKTTGNIYSRISNPTVDVLEQRIAALEGGIGALAVSSGQSASTMAVLNITQSGDEIISCSTVYGGTYNLFASTMPKMGIKVNFVKPDDFQGFENAINEKTKCIYAETIGNPQLNIIDIEKLAQIAHKHNIPLIVDNTVATPFLCRPFEHGADIVIHSATKYLGGHGTTLGGLIVDSGNFDWVKSGKFPELCTPDPTYHGLIYTEAFKKAAYIAKARTQLLRDMGSCLSPFNAFLLLQGVETLHLRMQRHSENALKLAKFLQRNEFIKWVVYPGLDDYEFSDRAKKYLPNGQSSLISFGIKGGLKEGIKFIESLKLVTHATNLGDLRTIITYPAGTTHRQLNDKQKQDCGITDDFLRISVGLENIEDIIKDINQALKLTEKVSV